MVAVAALASCDDDAKPTTTDAQVASRADGGTVEKTDPAKEPEKLIDPVTAVPPYGVAMPPPRDDEGLAVPAYGVPPPPPTE